MALKSSFIQTLLSVLEFHQFMRFSARGLYRRSGISPCPEDKYLFFMLLLYIIFRFVSSVKSYFVLFTLMHNE